MHPPLVTKDPGVVEAEVQTIVRNLFPETNPEFVSRFFQWTIDAFAGGFRDYAPIDAPYHDLEHTLQGTLCMARLLHGRHVAGAEPRLTEHIFRLGLISILLHDTGYLKKRGEDGTGAKYTITHVERGVQFAAEFLGEKGFSAADIGSIQNMIHCTGLDAAMNVIPFNSVIEKLTGFALGTGDLLGQMAADDYVEKLPMLFEEFAEAARFTKDKAHFISMYSSARDLMKKTPFFWDKFVRVKLDREFGGVYRFLNDPYPDGPNFYLQRVEANIDRLRKENAKG